jgi:DNA polymerase V
MHLPQTITIARLIGPAAFEPLLRPLPRSAIRIQMGFPSPAEDFQDDQIDLNRFLIRNPPATYIYQAAGWSMSDVGILDGDILMVDRSVQPRDGDLVVATWDGNQPVCKILKVAADHIELHSRNPLFQPIVLSQGTEVEVFAVVSVARQIRRGYARTAASPHAYRCAQNRQIPAHRHHRAVRNNVSATGRDSPQSPEYPGRSRRG